MYRLQLVSGKDLRIYSFRHRISEKFDQEQNLISNVLNISVCLYSLVRPPAISMMNVSHTKLKKKSPFRSNIVKRRGEGIGGEVKFDKLPN